MQHKCSSYCLVAIVKQHDALNIIKSQKRPICEISKAVYVNLLKTRLPVVSKPIVIDGVIGCLFDLCVVFIVTDLVFDSWSSQKALHNYSYLTPYAIDGITERTIDRPIMSLTSRLQIYCNMNCTNL